MKKYNQSLISVYKLLGKEGLWIDVSCKYTFRKVKPMKINCYTLKHKHYKDTNFIIKITTSNMLSSKLPWFLKKCRKSKEIILGWKY